MFDGSAYCSRNNDTENDVVTIIVVVPIGNARDLHSFSGHELHNVHVPSGLLVRVNLPHLGHSMVSNSGVAGPSHDGVSLSLANLVPSCAHNSHSPERFLVGLHAHPTSKATRTVKRTIISIG